MKRDVLARVLLGADELVLSLDAHDRLDIRLWTDTGRVRMASANGLTIPFNEIPKLIAALQDAARGKEAA